MSAARKLDLLSVEDYLAGEVVSTVKHEYLCGLVYAMAGGRNAHNLVAGNIFGTLHARLKDQPSQPFNSDTKIRVQLPNQIRFYYPDVSVVCESNPPDDSYQDNPVATFEVLSLGTRRIDEGEKKDAYQMIPSLRVYGLVEQDSPTLVVFRRTSHGFDREVYEGLNAVLPLPDLDLSLPLADIYARVKFAPEADPAE